MRRWAPSSRRPEVREQPRVALAADEGTITIKAWLSKKNHVYLSIIARKQRGVERLLPHLIADSIASLAARPGASTDTTHLRALKARG